MADQTLPVAPPEDAAAPQRNGRSPREMNYERLYQYRFRGIDQNERIAVWREISPHVHKLMRAPQKILDPAAGRGEFIGTVPSRETWAVDEVSYPEASYKPDTNVVTASILDAELPLGHFDGVFMSNFLEHLPDQKAIAAVLAKMHDVMEPGGRIAVMGPNYRFCSRDYWDCADHYVALTDRSIGEHLYAAGFEPTVILPRYLPYSFRGRLPASPLLTRLYLKTPPAWKLFGKQFLVVGCKEVQEVDSP